jgi:hypothetical protein
MLQDIYIFKRYLLHPALGNYKLICVAKKELDQMRKRVAELEVLLAPKSEPQSLGQTSQH